MIRNKAVIKEINSLWMPVYPFLADVLLSRSGIRSGRVLDLGPFSGGIALNVLWKNEGFLATVLDESEEVLLWIEERGAEGGHVSRLTTRRASFAPLPEADASFDLVVVRGAFFFLTPSLLRDIRRVLRPGGYAWVGGGYGPTTPESVFEPIIERSRLLNEAIGKRRITARDAQDLIDAADLTREARVSEEGGLWIEVRV